MTDSSVIDSGWNDRRLVGDQRLDTRDERAGEHLAGPTAVSALGGRCALREEYMEPWAPGRWAPPPRIRIPRVSNWFLRRRRPARTSSAVSRQNPTAKRRRPRARGRPLSKVEASRRGRTKSRQSIRDEDRGPMPEANRLLAEGDEARWRRPEQPAPPDDQRIDELGRAASAKLARPRELPDSGSPAR